MLCKKCCVFIGTPGRFKFICNVCCHKIIISLSDRGGCRSLSGTSVASPVVAGAISLLVR